MPGPLATRRILSQRPAFAAAPTGNDPTILGSNLKVWVEADSANIFTEEDGTGTVTDGTEVGYLAGLGGTPNFVNATSAQRPTWSSTNKSLVLGASLRLATASPIAVTGAFTVYMVGSRNNLTHLMALCGGASDESSTMLYSDNNSYCTRSGSSTYVQEAYTGATGLILVRWRRQSDDAWKLAATGMAEAAMNDNGGTNVLAGTFNAQTLGGRPYSAEYSNSASEIRCVILADKDAVAGGEDSTIRSYLLAKYPGLTDIP